MAEQKPADDNKIKITATVGGRTFEIDGDVNLKLTEIVGPVVPDPEPPTNPTEPTKPQEGTVKQGGWGANMDPKVWVRTVMKDFPDQFKVTDGSKNVATNFKTAEAADNFIKYFQRHPEEVSKFFDIEDGGGDSGSGGGGQQPLPDGVGLPYQVTGRKMDSTFRGPTKRNYASGKPSDWTIEKNVKQIQYENILAVADIDVHPPSGWEHDDDLCIKIGGTHMGSGWFCNGLGIYEGESGLGKEEKHPSTQKGVVKGKTYGDQRGKRVQVAATYFKGTNRTEYWVFKDGKWEMACGAENVGGFKPKNSGETESQLRIDGFAGENQPPKIHSFTVYEIKMQ